MKYVTNGLNILMKYVNRYNLMELNMNYTKKIDKLFDKYFEIITIFYIIAIYCFENNVYANIWNIIQVLFIITSFSYILIKGKLYFNTYNIWNFMIISISLLVTLCAFNIDISFSVSRTLISILISNILIIQYLKKDITKLYKICNAIIVGAVLKSLIMIPGTIENFYLLSKQDGYINLRLGLGTSENPNIIAMNLGIAFIMLLFLKKDNTIFKNKLIYLMSISIIGIGIILTGSRKVLYTIVLAMIINSLSNNNKRLIKIIITPVIIIIMYQAIIDIPILYESIGKRIVLSQDNKNISKSDETRKDLIKEGIDLVLKRPFGYGLNNSLYVTSSKMYTHNNYIEVLVCFGIIGFVLYYSIYIYLLKLLYRFRKNEFAMLFLVLIVSIMVMEIGQVTYMYKVTHLILLISSSYISIQHSNKYIAN